MGFNVVNYFARNIDKLLIGKFLGDQALGYYTLAYKIMLYPLQSISWVIGKVMFPAFSKIQHDLEKVRTAYLKMVKAISLVTFPMMFGLFAVAPEFVHVIYGPKWEPLILLIRILCFCGIVQSIGTTVGNIILSQGKSGLQLRFGILGTIFAAIAIMGGLKLGIVAIALFYTLEQLSWVLYVQRTLNSLIGLSLKTFFSTLRNNFIVGVCMFLFINILQLFLPQSHTAILVGSIVGGAIIYIGLLFMMKEIKLVWGIFPSLEDDVS